MCAAGLPRAGGALGHPPSMVPSAAPEPEWLLLLLPRRASGGGGESHKFKMRGELITTQNILKWPLRQMAN